MGPRQKDLWARPVAPSPNHEARLHECIAKGFHTSAFNNWMMNSQMNYGTVFQPQDKNNAIGLCVQRCQTFTMPVALHTDACKQWETVLSKTIQARVNAGACFSYAKSK